MLTLFYRLLISPIADLLPKSPEAPVVLIPQGQLFLLPFTALRDPAGNPFIEAHSLLVAPSIQTFGLLDRTRAASLAAALVMGNPVLGPLRLDPGSDVETQLPPLPEPPSLCCSLSHRWHLLCSSFAPEMMADIFRFRAYCSDALLDRLAI
jgi:CHAT domain-containing protein